MQNWAEVLERDFLVLEDTMRRVRKGGSDGGCSDPDCSGCSDGSGSWSGSRTPSRRGSSDVNRVLDGGDVLKQGSDDKGKAVENVAVSLDDHHVNTDETMGVDVPNTVAPPELGEQESVFASVENAISASISEAMATSISDLQGPLPIAKTEPQPLPEATVDNGRDQLEARHDEPVFDIPNSSADMEVDHDQPAPQTEADTEMPSKVTDYQSEAPYSIQDNAAVNDDKMDIDVENGVDQHPTSIQTDHPA